MRKSIDKYLCPALLTVAVIALLTLYYLFNPARYSLFPKCPFNLVTGFNCPGCGSQRAVYCLLHGRFVQAAGYNLLLIISLPFLAAHFYYKLISFYTGRDIRWAVLYHRLTPRVIFAVVIVFWIVRNIPAYPFSYLSAGH